ncbi:MAG: flagellar basal body L-ring protein FlgH [Proteobacteria bacterium]|nr:MAG: flagellar basal body L-ring protein FlgH [Pseudomonadota bacterium]
MLSPSNLRCAWRAIALASAGALSGCAVVMPPAPPAYEAAREPQVAPRPKGEAGGVFTPEVPWTLVADTRAFRPGDVLTVVLQETTQARKSADTRFGKQSSIAFPRAVVGGREIDSDIAIGGEREFSGNAVSTQQNVLQGSITVIVEEVLPNGLLRVSGEKSVYLNQGEEFVRLAGFVRATDIDSENRVSSQRIANARIAYSGRGPLNDANSAGWLTRFFTSPWMPF